MLYPAIIHKDAASDYGVSFPDFPGYVTAAASVEAAVAGARAASQLHVDGMLEDGAPLPAPSLLDAVYDDAAGGIVTVVAVDDHDPSLRINVTLEHCRLKDADAFAARHGTSRPAHLADALKERLAKG